VAENRFRPLKKGAVIKQTITMYLGKDRAAFHGWESLMVTKSIDSIANAFSFQIPQKFQQTNTSFRLAAGIRVTIFADKEKVITGFIERVEIVIQADRKEVKISGRSLPADLVDSTHEGKMEFKNFRLDALARELIRPFGLKVLLSVTPLVIKKVSTKPGDTIF